MGHYDQEEVKLRCEGNHEWGEPYLDSRSISVKLKDGVPCVKIEWEIVQGCQNDHTNTVTTSYNSCQKTKTKDRSVKYVPISELPEK